MITGSAVAVALEMCDAALGTDTAGSVRIPASLNGIVGFKPSIGRYETDGVIPLSFTRFEKEITHIVYLISPNFKRPHWITVHLSA